ncbi:Protoporphyrinogen oxidase [Sodiomyces alkalinus F11]|uniref:Protoporphyrinogen oxidase n=1 Tax=Sodiomyces alkalinus (strain CBS 110278 / VKM F-3762 / F11) TaxID=1314773 RepID=A0A3N2PLS5_SODAK|nr:Protoporphyrinogen oxidase [Sodiomyces alkalinus F11]ROT35468.1 Protoporphyrinogen oxidase [Sodiomyces alkalinus F11]
MFSRASTSAAHGARSVHLVSRGCRPLAAAASSPVPGGVFASVSVTAERCYSTEVSGGNVKNIAVIGGGITGLSTAHHLAKFAPKGTSITLYEGSARLGGWLDTQKVEFTHDGKKKSIQFERGPRTLRSYASETWRLDDLVIYGLLLDLGIEPSFHHVSGRYFCLDGKIVSPTMANLLADQKLRKVWLPVLKAWFRMKRKRLGTFDAMQSKQPPKDMSVGEFIRMLGGKSPLLDQLVSGGLHGIWGGDIDRLSMPMVLPKFWYNFWYKESRSNIHLPESETRLLHYLLADGADEVRAQEIVRLVKQSRKGNLMTLPGGMSSLPKAIAENLGQMSDVTINLGQPVTGLEYDESNDQILLSTSKTTSPMRYDKVISTINAKHLYQIAPAELPSLAGSESVTITAVNLFYPKEGLNHPYRGLGYLVPRNDESYHDKNGLLGVFFDSDALPNAAAEPKGTKLFVLLRGSHAEADAVATARAVLRDHLGINPSEPCVALARVNADCLPQHNVGHRDRMAKADAELASAFRGRLAVAGPSYAGVGIAGSIRAGFDIASHTLGALEGHVGSTGLAEFGEHDVTPVDYLSRESLAWIGRRVRPETPLWWHLIR